MKNKSASCMLALILKLKLVGEFAGLEGCVAGDSVDEGGRAQIMDDSTTREGQE